MLRPLAHGGWQLLLLLGSAALDSYLLLLTLLLTGPCSSPAAINIRTGRAIARRRRPDLSPPILVGAENLTLLLLFVHPGEFGDVWSGHRQRHIFARLYHIEISWKQHHEPAGMANATGNPSGIIAGTEVQIGARRSDNRRSRILRNHQAAKG